MSHDTDEWVMTQIFHHESATAEASTSLHARARSCTRELALFWSPSVLGKRDGKQTQKTQKANMNESRLRRMSTVTDIMSRCEPLTLLRTQT